MSRPQVLYKGINTTYWHAFRIRLERDRERESKIIYSFRELTSVASKRKKARSQMESQTVQPITVPQTKIVDRATWNELTSRMPKLHHTSFPKQFFWGAAGASYQYEGAVDEDGKGPSIWDTFTENHPEKLQGGSNGKVANDFYHKYKEDVKRMKDLGLTAFRFSISWSRVLPKGSLSGGVNEKGVAFYKDLIKELRANGMEPFVTLYHWDLPQALEDEYGGFLSTKIVKDYVDYAELCFKEFGDDVKYWITFNECWTFSSSGYAIGTHAPGRSSDELDIDDIKRYLPSSRCSYWKKHKCTGGDSGTEPYIVAHNQILAHAQAVKLYREKYQTIQCGVIGMTMNCNWMIPMTDTQEDRDAAQRGLDWMFGWFMDPLTFGEYPKNMQRLVGSRLPKFSDEEVELVKMSYDFLGLNYYTANYCIDAPDEAGEKGPNYVTDDQVIQTPEKDGVLVGPVAGSPWLHVYPQGMKDLLLYIKDKYNDPLIYITENGVNELNTADTDPEEKKFHLVHHEKLYVDPMRIHYHYEHLSKIKEAIEEGVNVKGYFAWSFLDNYEWAEGYSVRFGIYHVDYHNGVTRHPKLSSEWFKSFLN